MPPFLHKCLGCRRLWYTHAVEARCPKCGSDRRTTYRVTRYQPETNGYLRTILVTSLVVLTVAILHALLR